MRLKHLFYILAALQLALLALLFYSASQRQDTLFYIGEGLVVLVLLFLVYFYYKVLKPLDSIGNGMDLLNEQDFSSKLKPVGQQESDRIVQVFNKMMDQLKDEKLRMQEQNRFLDLLISASPMGVVMLDFDERITMMNDAAIRFLEVDNVERALHQSMRQFNSPLAQEIANIPLDKVETIRLSDSMIYRCSHLSFMDRGFARPFILIESLTEEVMKAEKKAYEKVIRMIAHEVNNNVAGIVSTLDLIQTEVPDGTAQEALEASRERTQKMAEFVTRFANVVKVPEPQLTLCDLSEEVEACHSSLEGLCQTHHIRLTLDLTDEAIPVHLDTTLFQQALVNIVKNAIESIIPAPSERKGFISIKVAKHSTSLPRREGQGGGSLIITDNGKGISPEVAQHIFTPFYSTKPQGQGLGLLLIRDILTKHGCTFTLLTNPDDGLTRFTIMFP